MAKEVREIKEQLEPTKDPMDVRQMSEIYSQNPRVLGDLDDVRTLLLQGKSGFYYRCPVFAK